MPPEYCLLTCETAGEALVGSAVAKKLEGLGALTKGDKSAGRGETGGLGTNFETKNGVDALTRLKNSMLRRPAPSALEGGGVKSEGGYLLGRVLLGEEEGQLIRDCDSVKKFLTRLQLVPYALQQTVLRAFTDKIQQTDEAMASQLESSAVRIVGERVVFQNPRNEAEKVTVTEIECDYSCPWAAAMQTYNDNAQKQNFVCFGVEKDVNGRPSQRLFLAVSIDAQRVRLTYPHRISAAVYPFSALQHGSFTYNMADAQHQRVVAATWSRNLQAAMAKRHHLESFALLNGSVFSIWYNVKKAMDPRFDPDRETRDSMREEAMGGVGSSRLQRQRAYSFEPNVKIQLVTTSDGKKLGGIRLSTVRPLVHRKRPWHANCNRQLAILTPNPALVLCRKKDCLIEGYSEVDKLVKGLAMYTRALT